MQNKRVPNWMNYLGLGMQLLVLLALGLWGGMELDKRFNMSPFLTLTLPLLVLIMTLYRVIRETSKRKNKDE